MTIWWLQNVFDPHTKARAGRNYRLVILDGAGIHTPVRDIVLLFLPANFSAVFQPLDVQFFRTLKGYYDNELHVHMLESNASAALKGLFYRWFQVAWTKTIILHQITTAWRQAGLWPIHRAVMRAVTPLCTGRAQPNAPMTPRSVRTLQSRDRAVRRGSVEGGQAFLKVSKAFVELEAENVLLRGRLAKQEATAQLEKRAKNANCLTRFPQGQVFDQRY